MYSAQITRRHKGALVILIDRSGSMAEKVVFEGATLTKAEVLSECVNSLLEELINRCYREYYVGDYFDVAIVGYSAERAEKLLGGGFCSIAELDRMNVPVSVKLRMRRLPTGERFDTLIERRQWVAPVADGRTPMGDALRVARRLCLSWCRKHPQSLPPIVINITDGEVTDTTTDKVRTLAARLREVGTEDGNVLLINIHLADRQGFATTSVHFPSESEPLPEGRCSQLLYDISSTLPDFYNNSIEALHCGTPPFRAICYNSPIEDLVGLLAIGSSALGQML